MANIFAVSNCVIRACNRGENKAQSQQRLAERFDSLNAGEYEKLWSEIVSVKKPKRQTTNSNEEITVRAKTLCLQGHFGRPAKVLASVGLAHNEKAIFKAQKKLHPKEL